MLVLRAVLHNLGVKGRGKHWIVVFRHPEHVIKRQESASRSAQSRPSWLCPYGRSRSFMGEFGVR